MLESEEIEEYERDDLNTLEFPGLSELKLDFIPVKLKTYHDYYPLIKSKFEK